MPSALKFRYEGFHVLGILLIADEDRVGGGHDDEVVHADQAKHGRDITVDKVSAALRLNHRPTFDLRPRSPADDLGE